MEAVGLADWVVVAQRTGHSGLQASRWLRAGRHIGCRLHECSFVTVHCRARRVHERTVPGFPQLDDCPSQNLPPGQDIRRPDAPRGYACHLRPRGASQCKRAVDKGLLILNFKFKLSSVLGAFVVIQPVQMINCRVALSGNWQPGSPIRSCTPLFHSFTQNAVFEHVDGPYFP